jgi:plastocyanin
MTRLHPAAFAAAAALLAMSPGAGAAQAPKPATHTIVMEAVAFKPDVVTIKSGDSIVWVNKDPFPHTAVSKEGGFDSKNIDAGKSWKYTPKTKGEFAYICSLHPTMKATLRVK